MTLYAERPGYERGPGRGEDPFEPEERPRTGSRVKRLVVPVGAAAALVAVSLTVWYALGPGVRGGDGNIPLIVADSSPIKVRPEQPGGMEVPHQDKLVFERLNPGRAGTGKVERLLPGPEEPLPPPEPPPPDPVAVLPAAPATAPAAAPTAVPSPSIAIAAPDAIQAPAQPPALPTIPPAQAAPQPAPVPAPPIAKIEPPRPAAPQAAPQVATLPPPASAAGGRTIRLQIASVPSEATAKSELQRLQRRFPSELGGLPATIVRADLGARGTYFRVQVGPVDEARGSAVCSTLKAQSVGCLLIRP